MRIIIQAEIFVKPEYLDEVKAMSAATLKPTLAEPGCEVFYQTAKTTDKNTLVFFEVFVSQDAHNLHLNAEYSKAFFDGLKGKLAGDPIITILKQL